MGQEKTKDYLAPEAADNTGQPITYLSGRTEAMLGPAAARLPSLVPEGVQVLLLSSSEVQEILKGEMALPSGFEGQEEKINSMKGLEGATDAWDSDGNGSIDMAVVVVNESWTKTDWASTLAFLPGFSLKNIPGSDADWRIMAVAHELGHVQHAVIHGIVARTNANEIYADKTAVDFRAYATPDVVNAFMGMRAIASMTTSHFDIHHTNAGVVGSRQDGQPSGDDYMGKWQQAPATTLSCISRAYLSQPSATDITC